MWLLAQIVFWLCVLALSHTYLFYPWLMKVLARGKNPNTAVFAPDSADLPVVSVLMSLYNEEKVIAQKLDTLRRLQYPADKLRIFIGSDCSSDGTNALVEAVAAQFQFFKFYPFPQRRGKPPVINDLAREALALQAAGPDHIFLLTDASVMLQADTLYHLVKHFNNPQIGVVDAHMRSAGIQHRGISQSEHRYLSGEVLLKYHESIVWGKMIGPFGGCYALRSDLFEPVPPNFLVDDFYLTFRGLERGFSAINELEALCDEGATHHVRDEYRRKKRIAAGSFQNLSVFRRWVLPPVTTLGFAFFSHKVLRWFGGFLIATIVISAAILAWNSAFYFVVFMLICAGLLGVPLLNWLLEKSRIYILFFKNLTYFIAMNAALVEGFLKWRRGIRDNTWQRTQRY